MKQSLLLTFILVFSLGLVAQVTVEPDPYVYEGPPYEYTLIGHAEITNNFDEELILRWREIDNSLPTGWETSICDANLCYGDDVEECPAANPVILGPGVSGLLDIHLKSFNEEGIADICIEVFLNSNPDSILVTACYTFTLDASLSVEGFETEEIAIYPNPATNFFKISQNDIVASIDLYNIVGKKVKRYNYSPYAEFDISNLPNGLYLVSLLDKNESILKTVRMTIR